MPAILLIASLRLTNKKEQTKQFASLSDTAQKNDNLSCLKVKGDYLGNNIFVFFSSCTMSYRGILEILVLHFLITLPFFGSVRFRMLQTLQCYKLRAYTVIQDGDYTAEI